MSVARGHAANLAIETCLPANGESAGAAARLAELPERLAVAGALAA